MNDFEDYKNLKEHELQIYKIYLETELTRVTILLKMISPPIKIDDSRKSYRLVKISSDITHLNAVKHLREIMPPLGLKEAKNMCDTIRDGTPVNVYHIDKNTLERLQETFVCMEILEVNNVDENV